MMVICPDCNKDCEWDGRNIILFCANCRVYSFVAEALGRIKKVDEYKAALEKQMKSKSEQLRLPLGDNYDRPKKSNR